MEPEVKGLDSTSPAKVKGSETFQPALRCIVPKRRCAGLVRYVSFCSQALEFAKNIRPCRKKIGPLRPVMSDAMDDHTVNGSGQPEPALADLDTATRRLMAALDALERARERPAAPRR